MYIYILLRRNVYVFFKGGGRRHRKTGSQVSKQDSMVCSQRGTGGLGCLTKHRAPSPCNLLQVAWISCAPGVAPLAAKRNVDFLTKYMGIEMKMLVFCWGRWS